MRKIPKNKEQQEELVFDIFQNKYGLIEEKELIHDDEPDFVIIQNGYTLGVEIIVIYSDKKKYGKSKKEHEVAKERIVNRACERAEKIGLPPLDVYIIFTDDIPKGKEKDLTESLFKTVKNNIPCVGSQIDLDDYSVLPDGFDLIMISNQPSRNKSFWHCDEVVCVETGFTKQLQSIIDKKSQKYSNYLKKCSKCWLVIAALDYESSSCYEFDEDMETSCYKSSFEKVFFVEVWDETLKELKIS